jgi:lysine 6-dehydrogenase
MAFRYAVVGAGRQGVAAAYDMARFGNAEQVLLVDVHEELAQAGARRVNALIGKRIAVPRHGDVRSREDLARVLDGVDAVLSAVPYRFNMALTDMAIRGRFHMCDLGGNTDVTRGQMAHSAEAEAAGISVVPDCGMGPGLNVSLAVYAMSLLDEPEDVYIYDGGLPQRPTPPWNYALTFHIGGLTNEYAGEAAFLRKGHVVMVPGLSEVEMVDVPSLGSLEAAVTTGGLSTMPWTFEGRLRTLENKTLRYPGHWAQMNAYAQLGLLDLEPVVAGGVQVIPRQVFHALLEPRITQPDVRDVCIIYIRCLGLKGGRPAEAVVSLLDHYDEDTGFRAMERLTGWHASIVAILAAHGGIANGVIPIELALPGDVAGAEARRRGFNIQAEVRERDQA